VSGFSIFCGVDEGGVGFGCFCKLVCGVFFDGVCSEAREDGGVFLVVVVSWVEGVFGLGEFLLCCYFLGWGGCVVFFVGFELFFSFLGVGVGGLLFVCFFLGGSFDLVQRIPLLHQSSG